MRRRLWLGILTASTAWAALPPIIPGDSARGAHLFESERCVQCHSVNGQGGKMALDLSAHVDRGFTPALLASAMWNHAPVMWAAMDGAGIERPKPSPENAADLFAYLYSTRFFDKPGDAARGKEAFAGRHCAECHGIRDSLVESAPPVDQWQSLGHPVVLVQQMWNHSSRMREAFARKKIAWQQLDEHELSDILAYLRDLPETRGLTASFSFTSGEGGQAIFESKGCVKCHVGKLALEDRLHSLTLTEIAVDMWNHAPRMIQPVPQLSENEMRQLLSYLWMRQFVYAKGDADRGKQVFGAKLCGRCHMSGVNGAPPLPGQARPYSEITIISALWKHGPQMFTRMRQAKIIWPRFNNAQQMTDLVAYLNSVQ
jgi:mono/diheme cytochrome c family protein